MVAMMPRILLTVFCQSASGERLTAILCTSWQVVQRSVTSCLPSPSGRSLASLETLPTWSCGNRFGQAGGSIAPCLLVSAKPTFALSPVVTLTFWNHSLS